MIRRYKRFLADVQLASGEKVTAHVPNSGSMKGCAGDGWPVLLSLSKNPKRKLAYTLELVHNGKSWIGVHTGRTNGIVEEAILAGKIRELKGYESLRREVPYGQNSRVDLLLENPGERCYVEVKSVTLLCGQTNCFPDAVTERGRKHLMELIEMKRAGHRAVLFYLIQREDGKGFRPAREIDPAYADAMLEAREAGVEFLAYRTRVTPEGIRVAGSVRVEFA